MITVAKETRLPPPEVISSAVAFFGPGELGMGIVEQEEYCARFEGAGGYVFVRAEEKEDGGGSEVTVEGREWEYQIKQFLARI